MGREISGVVEMISVTIQHAPCHCEEPQATRQSRAQVDGLLRFARNDGEAGQ